MSKKTAKKDEVIDVECTTSEEIVTESVSNTKNDYNPLERCTVRDLLELAEVSLILGKKYENLTIAEGENYFIKKQEYNNFYNKIITELEHRVETRYMV